MMYKKQEKQTNIVKVALISAGIVVAVAAALAVLYRLFTKHFKITFDCSGDCDECGSCDCDENEWDFENCDAEPACEIADEKDEKNDEVSESESVEEVSDDSADPEETDEENK